MTISTRCIEPPPHLLKQWVQAAREAEKKGGPYTKTFAMAAIDWALNSQLTPNNLQIRSSEIAPPPELYKQWEGMPRSLAFEAAYRAGADQELEACCEWLVRDWTDIETADELRAARRPELPSLKKLALAALDDAVMRGDCITTSDALSKIRRALESLPD